MTQQMGVNPPTLKRLFTFLAHRSHLEKINNHLLQWAALIGGMPQGT
jgi:hypothetical protein